MQPDKPSNKIWTFLFIVAILFTVSGIVFMLTSQGGIVNYSISTLPVSYSNELTVPTARAVFTDSQNDYVSKLERVISYSGKIKDLSILPDGKLQLKFLTLQGEDLNLIGENQIRAKNVIITDPDGTFNSQVGKTRDIDLAKQLIERVILNQEAVVLSLVLENFNSSQFTFIDSIKSLGYVTR